MSNTGDQWGGGLLVQGTNDVVINCVIYLHSAPVGPDVWINSSSQPETNQFFNCCVGQSLYPLALNQGNKTNNPLFVNTNAGNYRLTSASPCVNTGISEGWMTGAMDLDGHSRIDRLGGKVDMGAYEFLPKGTFVLFR